MRTRNHSVHPGIHPATLNVLWLGVGILVLVACASTGMQRSAKSTASMQTVDSDIKQALLQVDVTNASLENLIRPGQLDAKKAFDHYSGNVAKMEGKGQLLVKHIDEMSARRLDYFAEWEKQGNTYANAEIRELSEQRRADLSAIFAEIPAASVGVKGALNTYLSDIREIQKYLSNDLTSKGIESITPTAQKAVDDGAELKETVKPVVAAIERARAETVQGGAQ
ncbi:MAG TPA: hypothetical protein DCS11_08560 [Syntrophus sp. (in: bacteria)]|jgi:hypothetical protein|nr:hypothetical protein [Syntrophus sp. (in: bacteria)]